MSTRNNLYIFVPSDLDLWPLTSSLLFQLLVSRLFNVRKYNGLGRMDGRTDRGQYLMWPPNCRWPHTNRIHWESTFSDKYSADAVRAQLIGLPLYHEICKMSIKIS